MIFVWELRLDALHQEIVIYFCTLTLATLTIGSSSMFMSHFTIQLMNHLVFYRGTMCTFLRLWTHLEKILVSIRKSPNRLISTMSLPVTVIPVYDSIPFVRYFTGAQVTQYEVDSYVQTATGTEPLKKGQGKLLHVSSQPLFDKITDMNETVQTYSSAVFLLHNSRWKTATYNYRLKGDKVQVTSRKCFYDEA